MKLFKTLRHLPGRFVALGALAAFAAAIAIPVTVFAAPSRPATCDLSCVVTFGNARIGDRLTALTNLNNKVANDLSAGRITSDQATALQNDISTNQSGLNTLKTKLDGETNITAARQDVKNIYEQFRIFAVVLPRDYHTLWLDMLTHLDKQLRSYQGAIQDAISKAPKSVQPQLNQLFSDFQAQLQEAESMIDAGQGQLATLTVNNFNNARSVYETALGDLRNDVKTAHRDIHKAAEDLHDILHILQQSLPSSTSSATPTATA
jgi:hypothetical protein